MEGQKLTAGLLESILRSGAIVWDSNGKRYPKESLPSKGGRTEAEKEVHEQLPVQHVDVPSAAEGNAQSRPAEEGVKDSKSPRRGHRRVGGSVDWINYSLHKREVDERHAHHRNKSALEEVELTRAARRIRLARQQAQEAAKALLPPVTQESEEEDEDAVEVSLAR